MLQRIKNLLNKTEKTTDESHETSTLGDGGAVFLGEGTYEDYEKEQETTQTWLKWVRTSLKGRDESLKIDR